MIMKIKKIKKITNKSKSRGCDLTLALNQFNGSNTPPSLSPNEHQNH